MAACKHVTQHACVRMQSVSNNIVQASTIHSCAAQ